MNYYPFHVGDYMAHTAHLDPLEDIAYRRLLDLYYLREQPIPADPEEAARLVRMKGYAAEVKAILAEFFELTDDGWVHSRCEAEIAKMQDKQTKAKASAQASVKARQANAQRTLSERSTEVELPTPIPILKSKSKSSCAERSDDHSSPVESIPLASGEEYPVTEQQAAEFARSYPAVNVLAELRRMRAWSMANPKNRKTRGGVLRFVNAWLSKAQDNAPTARAGPQAVSKTGTAFLALDRIANGNDFHEREHFDGLALAGDSARIPALAGPRS